MGNESILITSPVAEQARPALESTMLKAFLDTVAAPLVLVDSDGRIVRATSMAAELLRRGRNHLEGQAAPAVLGEGAPGHDDVQRAAANGGRCNTWMHEYDSAAGETVTVEFTAATVALDDGVGLVVHVTDLTALHHAENEGAEVRSLADTLLSMPLDCIIGVDVSGAITEFNNTAVKTFGYARDDVMGRPVVDVLVPENLRAAYRDAFTRSVEIGEGEFLVRPRELSALCADGTEMPIEVVIAPVAPSQACPCGHDDEAAFIASIRDISHRVEMREKLVMQQKLASLGNLTAGIAHEIKNPLNFVNNMAQATTSHIEELKELLAEGLVAASEELREDVDDLLSDLEEGAATINRHGRRANSIVDGMLLQTRGKTGVKELTDIGRLADEYANLAYHSVRANDRSFEGTIEISADDVAPVEVVPQDVSRVILNLVNNACYAVHKRHQEGEGPYEPLVSVHTGEGDSGVQVRVRDNGTGIARDVLEEVFTPFFTTKPPGEGTGLGLSICYEIIVGEHGGSLEADSDGTSYTEFVMTLPRDKEVVQ